MKSTTKFIMLAAALSLAACGPTQHRPKRTVSSHAESVYFLPSENRYFYQNDNGAWYSYTLLPGQTSLPAGADWVQLGLDEIPDAVELSQAAIQTAEITTVTTEAGIEVPVSQAEAADIMSEVNADFNSADSSSSVDSSSSFSDSGSSGGDGGGGGGGE